ncbi:zinc-dependent metalloprotease [Pedobacter sp. MC2016-24]|uniref:zinc-dependent metalloprotease n=1 Tax=Pedobacter sp. MC2016-24 TaxID=2780090 RepID=UPI00188024B5|nr:zinc-dependent metalloprotease [Pedobacter sp. MC2016-24]MBE9602384.1 zinc-dependent metalloprotease [Pedobacter sp. MC2016-24]
MILNKTSLVALFILISAIGINAQTPKKQLPKTPQKTLPKISVNKKNTDSLKKKADQDTTRKNTLKDYKTLLKKAKTTNGIFKVHQVETDYYFEIPLKLMEKDFLLVNKISSVPMAINEAGVNKGMNYENKVIRFYPNKLAKTVWVKTIVPQVESPAGDAITQSVKDNFVGSVIETFKIEAYSPDSSAVLIKVNKVFDGTEKSFNDVFNGIGLGTSAKTALSAIEHIKSFPQNLVVRSLLSTSVTEGQTTIPISVVVTTNLLLLPEKPMKPRFADDRVGYFTTPRWYFSDVQQKLETRELITKWKLEPKPEDRARYLKGELVEPVKPIVFYIDPSTPKQWRPYIIDGIHDWQKAFEAAGFKNAIQAKLVTDTADFDGDDVRYSVVTYAASPKSNAMGPAVVDPRSGEILESDVIWWHNVMTSLQYWMRVQTGVIDTGARKNNFSAAQMGHAIRFVSSHEIGHTLGLKHNMGASVAYPVDSLRSPAYTSRMGGTAPSIMDYARFNYVAQPEDQVTNITPQIGVYDKYAIAWGYRWLDTEDPRKDLETQKTWIAKHQNDPLYHYGEQQSALNVVDPRAQSEDIGDNAMKASTYGLKNLQRLIPQILSWSAEPGDSYLQAGKLYMAAIWQWNTYAEHVMANVGGYYLENPVAGDGKKAYTPVPKATQEEAMTYLKKELFDLPQWLFNPALLSSTFAIKDTPLGPFEYGPYNLKREQQYSLMYSLVSDERLLRLFEMESIYGKDKVYTVSQLLQEISASAFQYTKKGKSLSLDERMTEQNYVDVLLVSTDKLMEKINKKALLPEKTLKSNLPELCDLTPRAFKQQEQALQSNELRNIYVNGMTRTSDVAAAKRGELLKILNLLETNKRKGDQETQNHHTDLILRIKQSLKIN